MSPEATVFVVDDNDTVRHSLRALLESANHAVVDYDSAEALLGGSDVERGDCILADMRMPNMTGLELQQELSRRGITVPFILVTGHADVPLAVSAMKAGAADFIEKPYDDEALLASVSRALHVGRDARARSAEAKAAAAVISTLTEREHQVLDQLVLGQSNKLVAQELGISPRTVEVHRARILDKMKARSLADLVRAVHAVNGRGTIADK
jgi:two-component system response regulator FixJ